MVSDITVAGNLVKQVSDGWHLPAAEMVIKGSSYFNSSPEAEEITQKTEQEVRIQSL